MLHTGTMFAVIGYFWHAWQRAFFSSREALVRFARFVIIATAVTGILALGLKFGIERVIKHQHPGIEKAEVEQLFNHLELIAAGLAAVGALIFWSGLRAQKQPAREDLTNRDSSWPSARSRACACRSAASRVRARRSPSDCCWEWPRRGPRNSASRSPWCSTPAVVLWEGRRLIQHHGATTGAAIGVHDFLPSLIGMAFSFVAGLVALRLLSRLLERGKWWVFGIYCLVAAAGVFALYHAGY